MKRLFNAFGDLKLWEKVLLIGVFLCLFSFGFILGERYQLRLGILAFSLPLLLFLLASIFAILDNSDKGF